MSVTQCLCFYSNHCVCLPLMLCLNVKTLAFILFCSRKQSRSSQFKLVYLHFMRFLFNWMKLFNNRLGAKSKELKMFTFSRVAVVE